MHSLDVPPNSLYIVVVMGARVVDLMRMCVQRYTFEIGLCVLFEDSCEGCHGIVSLRHEVTDVGKILQ